MTLAASGGADDSTGGEGDGAGGDPGACGRDVAGPEPSDPACGGVDAELTESPATQADAFFNRVLEADRFLLQGIVGQYACGQAPIYRGS